MTIITHNFVAFMKDKLNTLFEMAQSAGSNIREKAAAAGQAALDNTVQAIEKWLEEFPKIESYGLQVTAFSFTMGLAPSLEVELTGSHADFPPEKLTDILAENKPGSLTGMIFNAVKTAYRLHKKVAQTPEEPLIVKIRLSLSPEISVFVGRPKVC